MLQATVAVIFTLTWVLKQRWRTIEGNA